MASNTVTIETAYLDTLLRRAQFHSGAIDPSPPTAHSVTIPKLEHESLLESSRQYTKGPSANLKRNLYRGGIAEETLIILIKDDTPSNEHNGTSDYSMILEPNGRFFSPQKSATPDMSGQSFPFGRNAHGASHTTLHEKDHNTTNGFHGRSHGVDDVYAPDGPDGNDAYCDGENGNNELQLQNRGLRQHYDKFAKRTILLANLPEGTTHSEIVEVVRGGMLLDIYLRTHDRAASISFLEEAAAQDFFRHVKRHDLYIKGKRVEIRWNDRQFILPGHVANKIAIGATRNLIIFNRSPKHTEESIREDLDHIHNLVVIDIKFSGKNVLISLNSVHNAMFARTCMMSRSAYKGYKIEWECDECAAPIDSPFPSRKNGMPSKKKESKNPVNRFQLLDLDGEDDGSGEDNLNVSGISA